MIVLNVPPQEQQQYIEELIEAGINLKHLPKRITNEYSVTER